MTTPASFLHLQACFGRFRSSRRNGERSTIQNLFSKHQHLKIIRRKRSFHPRVSVFSLCLLHFSKLVHFLLQHLSGTNLLHSRVTHLPSIHTALFLSKMAWKNHLCTTTERQRVASLWTQKQSGCVTLSRGYQR